MRSTKTTTTTIPNKIIPILPLSSTDDSSSTYSGDAETGENRDEVAEIKILSSEDTSRVKTWRLAVTSTFLVAALMTTSVTYYFLNQNQHRNFETAFDQFARTVSDAAIDQQKSIHDSVRTLSHAITAHAEAIDTKWPFFIMPSFEALALDFKRLSRAELVGVNNIVRRDEVENYTNYITERYQDFIQEGHMIAYGDLSRLNTNTSKYHSFIARKTTEGKWTQDVDRQLYYARTNLSPPPRAYGPVTNWNTASVPSIGTAMDIVRRLGNQTLISEVRPFKVLPAEEHEGLHSGDDINHPHSFVYHPISKSIFPDSEVVGTLTSAIAWDASMRNLLPKNVRGIYCVVRNNCNQSYSYEIDGEDAIYQGEGDGHESKYDNMEYSVNLSLGSHPDFETTGGHCMYTMSIYPTSTFRNPYVTLMPKIYAAAIAFTFAMVVVIFLVYDAMVNRRNEKLIMNAAKSNAIVSSVFPVNIRDKLIGHKHNSLSKGGSKSNLKNFIAGTSSDRQSLKDYVENDDSEPLADLFLETSVLFANISGFTAWSSSREPVQVLKLLEKIYNAFDALAKRRRVLKIETVGDCYVAACGLPDRNPKHGIAIARFSRDIMLVFGRLTKELEVTLGPDTGDLMLRIGINSGPVTAGVLRGDRARFQLFGDTVNTTARMEETGQGGRIHVSNQTANIIIEQGKGHWLQKRQDTVIAKGKGKMETYWLLSNDGDGRSVIDQNQSTVDIGLTSIVNDLALNTQGDIFNGIDPRSSRLVNWIVKRLTTLLQKVIARRLSTSQKSSKHPQLRNMPGMQEGITLLEEVKEIITLPEFDKKSNKNTEKEANSIVIPPKAIEELHTYVTSIATMYRNNPFHNFEHASHVMMSVTKLLSRIVAPIQLEDSALNDFTAATLYDHTYGIACDPLIQFACAFSALIHDVDHTGVGNPQLIQENAVLGKRYKERSVAEQNSLELSWNLLMEDQFSHFRALIYTTQEEMARFRGLVINSVMATDIMDTDLKNMRNARWEKAFQAGETEETVVDAVNRKATIVIEHLIQASDVAHTMQHWHVYRKWNQKLFEELYLAYRSGRARGNPADFWATGEIGFFDFYVIPLTKKLKDCGVFGKSSDEYLNYAVQNRAEWEKKGKEIVATMVDTINKKISKNAFQEIEINIKKEEQLKADIKYDIEDNVEKAKTRLDPRSNNMIGAGLAIKKIIQLKHEYEYVKTKCNKLRKLEYRVKKDFTQSFLAEKELTNIMSMEMEQIPTIDMSDKRLVEEFRSLQKI